MLVELVKPRMPISYFKRLRMEIDVRNVAPALPTLPEGYEFRAWHPVLTEAHARAKFASFRGEVDALIFPCLGEVAGCRRLVRDISLRRGFVPLATWLICQQADDGMASMPCATIQGVIQSWSQGAIQNIGVVPEHRGLGLGRALLLQSLHGFRLRKVKRIWLEVTADNKPAVALYQSIGFVTTATSYRAVNLQEPMETAS